MSHDVSSKCSTIAIDVRELSYRYKQSMLRQASAVLKNVSLQIPKGSRVLVVGRNGAGKSTLLSILGGTKLIPEDSCFIFGRPAFHDIELRADVLLLSDHWKTEYCADISVRHLLAKHLSDSRCKHLVDVLDVDLDWSISRISDGQRRRCQLLVNFLQPKSVYLLDEISTDLDLLARDGVMELLRNESEMNGATVLYATHIFDGLDGWPTHMLYLVDGKVTVFEKMQDIQRYSELVSSGHLHPLYHLLREWFTREQRERMA